MTPGAILQAIRAFCTMVATALGFVSKVTDIQAGVDKQRALNLEKTLEKQQEVDRAPDQLATPERDARDADPAGWLRSRPKSP